MFEFMPGEKYKKLVLEPRHLKKNSKKKFEAKVKKTMKKARVLKN